MVIGLYSGAHYFWIAKENNINTNAKLMEPTNLAESVPPKVTSPLTLGKVVVGSKEIPTWFAAMTACAKRLSVTMTGIFEWK